MMSSYSFPTFRLWPLDGQRNVLGSASEFKYHLPKLNRKPMFANRRRHSAEQRLKVNSNLPNQTLHVLYHHYRWTAPSLWCPRQRTEVKKTQT